MMDYINAEAETDAISDAEIMLARAQAEARAQMTAAEIVEHNRLVRACVEPIPDADALAAVRKVAAGIEAHTLEADFQHFLSYSGLWRQTPEVVALLRRAFEAGRNA